MLRGPPGIPQVTLLLCEGLPVNPGLEQPLSQITHVVHLIRRKNDQERGSLVGCRLWGHTELDTTEVT